MKCLKSTALAILTALSFTSAAAEYQYVPLVQDGARWDYATTVGFPYTIYINGDSVIGVTTYKKCYLKIYDKHKNVLSDVDKQFLCAKNNYLVALLREQDKKVYAAFQDDFARFFIDYDFGTGNCMINSEYFNHLDEWLIYDFNDVASVLKMRHSKSQGPYVNYDFAVTKEEMVEIDGHLRKSYDVGVNVYNVNDSLLYDAPCKFGLRIIEGVGLVQSEYGSDRGHFSEPFLFVSPAAKPISIDFIGAYGLSTTYFRQMTLNGKSVVKAYDFMAIDDVDGESPTGVSAIDADRPAAGSDDNYYDLMGRKVNPENMFSGIYIHNHKKVMVKR